MKKNIFTNEVKISPMEVRAKEWGVRVSIKPVCSNNKW